MYSKKRLILIIALAIAYIALVAFFVYQCCLTGEKSSEQSDVVVDIVVKPIEQIGGKPVQRTPQLKTLIRKLVGHMGFFAVWGTVSIVLFIVAFPQSKGLLVGVAHFSIGLAFAFFSEYVLQANTQGRGPGIKDVLIDYGGYLLFSLFIFIIYYALQYKKNHAIHS